MTHSKNAIGIFDSGLGGLTVMKSIKELLPNENIIYFGDTARVPYGNKSAETIRRYSLENSLFLKNLGIKVLVIACHTACAFSLKEIEETLEIPVVGVIKKGVDKLIQTTKTSQVAVLSTRATASSGVYQRAILEHNQHISVNNVACPLFVPLIEEGYDQHMITSLVVKEYISQLPKEVDSILLACTHYPLIKSVLQKEIGEAVTLIDPGLCCAQSVKETLTELDLLNPKETPGSCHFFVSDDPKRFRQIGERFLSTPIESVTCTATPSFEKVIV